MIRRPLPGRSYLYALMLAALSIAFVVPANKLSHGGWAQYDFVHSHLPVLLYFRNSPLKTDYPNLVAMIPGWHWSFAVLLRLLFINISPTNYMPFVVLHMALFALFFALLLSHAKQSAYPTAPLFILLSSSYVILPLIWPTTDAFAVLAFAAAVMSILRFPDLTLINSTWFSLLLLINTLFRTNLVCLVGVPYLLVLFEWIIIVSDCRLHRLRIMDLYNIVKKHWHLVMFPSLVGLVMLFALAYSWGSLVPPGFETLVGHNVISVYQFIHIVALMSLVCAPFFIFVSLRELNRNLVRALCWMALCLMASGIMVYFTDISFDRTEGRWGSVIWTIPSAFGLVGQVGIVICCAVGLFLFLRIVMDTLRRKGTPVYGLALVVFTVSLLPQAIAYQRYVEPYVMFLCASHFFAAYEIKGSWLICVTAFYVIFLTVSVLKVFA